MRGLLSCSPRQMLSQQAFGTQSNGHGAWVVRLVLGEGVCQAIVVHGLYLAAVSSRGSANPVTDLLVVVLPMNYMFAFSMNHQNNSPSVGNPASLLCL